MRKRESMNVMNKPFRELEYVNFYIEIITVEICKRGETKDQTSGSALRQCVEDYQQASHAIFFARYFLLKEAEQLLWILYIKHTRKYAVQVQKMDETQCFHDILNEERRSQAEHDARTRISACGSNFLRSGITSGCG